MSTTLLEITRTSHEQVEQLQRLIIKHHQQKQQQPAASLFHSHRIRDLIDSIIFTTHKLIEIYQDGDNSRKDEIASLGGGKGAKDMFSYFYNRVQEIVEYHRRHPNAAAACRSPTEDAAEDSEEPIVCFSGEECNGRYLDLHELYNEYINIVPCRYETPFMDYSDYLDLFSTPDRVPPHLKRMKGYKKYLERLLEYLTYFVARTDPLKDLSMVFSKVDEETENISQEQERRGSVITLEHYTTAKELMEVGSQKLKEALAALGLKTGGTVSQQAERLIATKHTPLEELDRKCFSKGKSNQIRLRTMEIKVKRICELLSDTIKQTKEYVERKQILTYNEIKAEHLQHNVAIGDDGNDTEEEDESHSHFLKFHNGKPIEKWKYKLHGLKQGFECEICGNYTYWGRREFELHFTQQRHQYGMRCLSIPNSKSFYEITSIDEAKALWEKIKQQEQLKKWRPELEEFEDGEGNIYSRKMYNELKRQRLV